MDKSEFMYRYINDCVYPYCLWQILKENYDTLDDNTTYSHVAHSFQEFIFKFDEKFADAQSEEDDKRIKASFTAARQKIIEEIVENIHNIFHIESEKIEEEKQKLKEKLMSSELTSELFLELARQYRAKESIKEV